MFRYYDASKSLLWLCIGTIMITISSSFVLKPNGGVSLLSKNYLAADRTKAVVQPIRTTNPITLTTTQLFSNKVEATIDTKFMWNSGLSFGKGQFKFYKSFNEYMSVFPAEDRNNNPELFNLPTGLYEVSLRKPMGIVFEEIEMNKGLYVKDIVPGSIIYIFVSYFGSGEIIMLFTWLLFEVYSIAIFFVNTHLLQFVLFHFFLI